MVAEEVVEEDHLITVAEDLEEEEVVVEVLETVVSKTKDLLNESSLLDTFFIRPKSSLLLSVKY